MMDPNLEFLSVDFVFDPHVMGAHLQILGNICRSIESVSMLSNF